MRPYSCPRCRQAIFFENSTCLNCSATLGYDPVGLQMRAFDSTEPDAPWHEIGARPDNTGWRPCRSRLDFSACNWMVAPDDPHELCLSCRLTATRPDLSVEGHVRQWAEYEQAKRRLIYGLIRLGLPPQPKTSPDDRLGLAFHFLASQPGQPRVLTGHEDGSITLSLDEADDVHRESVRASFGEPWRTLLGHLRHETSHYLQYRWIATDVQATEQFRAVFGDERADYDQALARHHQAGPPPGWEQQYISAYASAHPHEDWAETCAHVLLVLDAIETAQSWGLSLSGPTARAEPAAADLQVRHWDELLVSQWLPVAQFLNAMNRSIGVRDSYPFLMPGQVVRRLATVATLLRQAAERARNQGTQPSIQNSSAWPA